MTATEFRLSVVRYITLIDKKTVKQITFIGLLIVGEMIEMGLEADHVAHATLLSGCFI